MSGKLIFKMELFKYMKDKRYLIATGVLAIINICSTVYLTHLIDIVEFGSTISSPYIGFFSFFFVISVFANIVFMFLYPFHLLSMDYKNDVMAMLMASGVNRVRLFFSKIGATFFWSIAVTFILVFIPSFIVTLKISQTTGLMEWISQIFEAVNVDRIGTFALSFNLLNNYINVLILISAATILMKGKNLTILVYFVFSLAQGLIINVFNIIPNTLDFSYFGYQLFESLLLILCSFILILISLNIMKRQNL